MTETDAEPWYAVRCVFRDANGTATYEERITLWRAGSFDEAITRAESEAEEYAGIVNSTYLGPAQAFHLAVGDVIEDGDEVFSLDAGQ
ncbi:MAG: hypothetical protein SGJ13_11310 [Actinomycetota bacterium]|nr:hypothetical protein [Actinomycetota bacterium]